MEPERGKWREQGWELECRWYSDKVGGSGEVAEGEGGRHPLCYLMKVPNVQGHAESTGAWGV